QQYIWDAQLNRIPIQECDADEVRPLRAGKTRRTPGGVAGAGSAVGVQTLGGYLKHIGGQIRNQRQAGGGVVDGKQNGVLRGGVSGRVAQIHLLRSQTARRRIQDLGQRVVQIRNLAELHHADDQQE